MATLKQSFIPLLIALLFLLIGTISRADVYQYFDEEGTLIVTDDPYGTKKARRPFRSLGERREDVKADNPPSKRPEAGPNFREDVSYDFYAVSAGSVHEAIAAIERLGPYDSLDNRRYAGQTRWRFGLSYKLEASYRIQDNMLYASARIHDIDFDADITVILPELTEESRSAMPDIRPWEEFLRHLAEHEHDHVKIIREPRYREDLMAGISAIGELVLPLSAGEHTETVVNRAFESKVADVAHGIMRRIKQINDEYDDLTDHGRKPEFRSAFFQRL